MYLIIVSRGNIEGDGGVGDTSGRTVRFVEEILYSNPWNLILGFTPDRCFVFAFVFLAKPWLVGFQFPDQGLNLGPGSESMKS